jgi:hypothetical protein
MFDRERVSVTVGVPEAVRRPVAYVRLLGLGSFHFFFQPTTTPITISRAITPSFSMSSHESVEQMERDFEEMGRKLELAQKRRRRRRGRRQPSGEPRRRPSGEPRRRPHGRPRRRLHGRPRRRLSSGQQKQSGIGVRRRGPWKRRGSGSTRWCCKAWRLPSVRSCLLPLGRGRRRWRCGG